MRGCGENESESVFQKPSKSLTQRDRQVDGGTDTHVHTCGSWGEGAESRALDKSPGPRLTSPLYHWTV